MTNVNTFDNIINLSIRPDVITEKCRYYFPHVTSIKLGGKWRFHTYYFLEKKHIKSLKMIVNLSNVKHLSISSDCKFEASSVLLELLKEAPQISSLNIYLDVLITLFHDDELCKYLNKMIQKLDISNASKTLCANSNELNQICTIFSNLEQLTWAIDDVNALLFMSRHLSKLTRINVYYQSAPHSGRVLRLVEELRRSDINMFVDYDVDYYTELSIWINKETSTLFLL
jgi:hypothetical protein